MSRVVWHDVECGSYTADLALWRRLAAAAGGPVLDVGAGTGRVSLDLARRGHQVVALDADAELLAALDERSAGLPVSTVCADARDFRLGRRFALVLVPMQTLQLLGGPEGRACFLRCAARHLEHGGMLAAALADALDGVASEEIAAAPPLPDVLEVAGVVYSSQVVAVRDQGERVAIDRIRQTAPRGGRMRAEGDVIALDRLDAATVAAEAAPWGLAAREPLHVPATDEHVGSEVVVLWRP